MPIRAAKRTLATIEFVAQLRLLPPEEREALRRFMIERHNAGVRQCLEFLRQVETPTILEMRAVGERMTYRERGVIIHALIARLYDILSSYLIHE